MKFEFCSADWVKAAREFVLSAASGVDLANVRISFNEVFKNAPPHLDPDLQGRIGWYLNISNGDIEVERGVLDNPDMCISGDYATIVPLARMVFGDDPGLAAEAQALVEDAMKKGLMSREGDETAMAELPWLAGLHDAMARVTA